jgi:hypothetical protein
MSITARWRPALRDGGFIDYRLKEILAKRFGSFPVRLQAKDLDFLDGVHMAGVHARDVMDAIEQHGLIIVELES